MLTCGLTLLILLGEGGALYWWRQRRFPAPTWTALFGGWTWTIYAALLLAGLLVGWAATYILVPVDPSAAAARPWIEVGVIIMVLVLIALLGLMLFFRWVIGTDIKDIPD